VRDLLQIADLPLDLDIFPRGIPKPDFFRIDFQSMGGADSNLMGPTGQHRVLQIHPTRQCNLQCLHFYSLSGPKLREALEWT
jgi:hypothetical protein